MTLVNATEVRKKSRLNVMCTKKQKAAGIVLCVEKLKSVMTVT